MSRILHMSDFHFGKDWALEKERLAELASWIKSNQIQIDYLIFTGDMIDSQVIQANCVRKLKKRDPERYRHLKPSDHYSALVPLLRDEGEDCINPYNDLLRQTMSSSMKQAGSIFLEFIKQIDIDRHRVVLCCGNHDRMRFVDENEFTCDGENCIDENSITAPFEAYDLLCSMVNDKLSHQTMVYSCDGVNFVIANSNWKAPVQNESNNMCINCKKLSEKLSSLKESKDFNRGNNIFISHKPFDDFCETVKYPYSGELLTVSQIIAKTVVAFLYGDKHSYTVKMRNELPEFMCGLPLSFCGVRYNLLEYDTTHGIHSCQYILNDGKGWVSLPIMDCMEELYNKSKVYLKGNTAILLTGDESAPNEWNIAIKAMQGALENGTMTKLSNLFASFCELRQDRMPIGIENATLFDQIVKLIERSPLQSVSIKGRPGVGKSTFVTVIYLYILWLFWSGRTRYIPFYFNFDKIYKERNLPENVDEYIEFCVTEFSGFIHECYTLSRKHNLPMCLLLDGLEKSKILTLDDNTLEKKIYQVVETTLEKDKDRYVMCFNTRDEYRFDLSFEKINRFEYVLFMNRIRILPYKSEERKLDMFLSAYLSLRKKNADPVAVDRIKKSLVKFHRPSMDIFFLRHCDEHVFRIEENEEIWGVLKEHLADLERIADGLFEFRIDLARQAAGLLFSRRMCYVSIVEKMGSERLTISEFLSLVNSPVVMEYFIASYFVKQLSKYSNTSDKIPQNSILYSFMPNEHSIMIRLLLDEKGDAANEILARFLANHERELGGYLYSTIAYLCGHLRTGDNSSLFDHLPEPNRESNDFFALCHCRSYDLATAIRSAKRFPVENILLELISNENYRKFNRSYQIHYYQDASNNAIGNQNPWNPDEAPRVGFDFRYSFLMLLSKLEPALHESKLYPLMELDLFTLCDLIYSRLQRVAPDALFYYSKYNEKDDSECEAILGKANDLLKDYNRLYGGKRSADDRIGAYFSLMHTRLTVIQKEVAGNKGRDVVVPYVSPCYDLTQILRLELLPRVGWNIDAPGPVKNDNLPRYEMDEKNGDAPTPIRETIMEHVMECVYIAQIFLPESLPYEGYKKSIVISMLLFSELGKTYSGDYTPQYWNNKKLSDLEKQGLAHMLTLGALDGYAAQNMFFEPLSGKGGQDINLRICREIKMIQTEYKYYTLNQQLGFVEERRVEFEDDFEEPTTNICKKIREQLIHNNPSFIDFLNSH